MTTRRFVISLALLALSLAVSVQAVPMQDDSAAFRKTLHGWRLVCLRDAMTDATTCTASRQNLSILLMGPTKDLYIAVSSERKRYPGRACFVRIDASPARQASGCDWVGPEAAGIIRDMLRGQTLVTRYTVWPSGLPETAEGSLAEFPAVWAMLEAAYAAHAAQGVAAR